MDNRAVLENGTQEPVQAHHAEEIAEEGNHKQKKQPSQEGASSCMSCQQKQFIQNDCNDQYINDVIETETVCQTPYHVTDCTHDISHLITSSPLI